MKAFKSAARLQSESHGNPVAIGQQSSNRCNLKPDVSGSGARSHISDVSVSRVVMLLQRCLRAVIVILSLALREICGEVLYLFGYLQAEPPSPSVDCTGRQLCLIASVNGLTPPHTRPWLTFKCQFSTPTPWFCPFPFRVPLTPTDNNSRPW